VRGIEIKKKKGEEDRKKDKKREKETLTDRQTKYVQERWLVSSHAFHSKKERTQLIIKLV
jgi:hypothetical protein